MSRSRFIWSLFAMSAQFICDHFADVLGVEYLLETMYYQESTRHAITLIRSTRNLYKLELHQRALRYCASYYTGFKTMNRHSDDPDFSKVDIMTVGAPAAVYIIAYYIAYIQESDAFIGLKYFIVNMLLNNTRNKWDIIEELTMCHRFIDIVAIQRRILKCTQYGGIGRPTVFITTTSREPQPIIRRFVSINSVVRNHVEASRRSEASRRAEALALELVSRPVPNKEKAFPGDVMAHQVV